MATIGVGIGVGVGIGIEKIPEAALHPRSSLCRALDPDSAPDPDAEMEYKRVR